MFKPYIKDIENFPREGVTFKDLTPLFSTPVIFNMAINQMLERCPVEGFDYVIGIESRGFIFGSSMAYRSSKGFIPIRKSGKLPPPTIQMNYSLEYGDDSLEINPGSGRIVLVDDVLATGGTLEAATRLCELAGYTVLARIVLVNLKSLNSLSDVRSVVTY